MTYREKISKGEIFPGRLHFALRHGKTHHEVTCGSGLKIPLWEHERALSVGQKNVLTINFSLINNFF